MSETEIINTWRGAVLRKYPKLPCASVWITKGSDFEHLEGIHFEPKQVGIAPGGAPVYIVIDNATLAYLNGKSIDVNFEVVEVSNNIKDTNSGKHRQLDVVSFRILGLADRSNAPNNAQNSAVIVEPFEKFLVRWMHENTILRSTLINPISDDAISIMRSPTNDEMQQ